jgi:uncharacterized protein (TIGR02001 family)
MKKLMLAVTAAATLGAMPALAADLSPMPRGAFVAPAPASPWDIAFGGALMTDYNFRGISQSNKSQSVTAYEETRYTVNPNWQIYAGSQYWGVDLPNRPSCECDLYGGVRPTFGAWAFDFGYIYYWYPKGQAQFFDGAGGLTSTPNGIGLDALKKVSYWEVYGKLSYDLIKDRFNVGANVYYSPSWLNTGASGLYASGTAKFTGSPFMLNIGPIDQVGWYISGEVGHYNLGTATAFGSPTFDLPDYWTWNAGLAFTYKVFTVDVRYYDTDLSKQKCFTLTGDFNSPGTGVPGTGTSKWCGSTVIGKFSADLTAMTNLK